MTKKRNKETVETELAELRKQEQEIGARITRVESELDEILSLEEEAQGKFVNRKISEFNTQRDRGKPDPFQIGGQQ